jgi:hypothetical protein
LKVKEAKMDNTLVGGFFIALGVVFVVFPVIAELVGIGIGESGFGWEETLGVILGAVAIVAGLALMFVERVEDKTPLPH